MFTFTEEEQRQIDEFIAKTQMSKRMTEEFLQICVYLHCLKAKMPSLPESHNGAPKLNKLQSKEAIKRAREYALTCAADTNGGREQQKENQQVETIDKPVEKIAYVEEQVKAYPLTKELVKLADRVVYINHYKDVFNAKGHDFAKEKASGSFIVAANKDSLFYPGAPFCQSFGNEHFYYTSLVKNCIFNCDYCYLQGLYPCGYQVYFVNTEDYFAELENILSEHSVYLCVSYDTDLLALENRLHYVEKWVDFCSRHENLKIEVRTKNGNAAVFGHLVEACNGEIPQNVIFAWTISPKEVETLAERGLPSGTQRINALKAAGASGFKTRICFDPMIYHVGWEEHYRNLFDSVFAEVAPASVLDVSVGVFRISNNFLNTMRKVKPESAVIQFPYITENGACHYGDKSAEMMGFAVDYLQTKYPELREKVYGWEG